MKGKAKPPRIETIQEAEETSADSIHFPQENDIWVLHNGNGNG